MSLQTLPLHEIWACFNILNVFKSLCRSYLDGLMWTHTDIKIQRMILNNGDNQQKACFVMFRLDLNILLIVTIVEVHTLNLDICLSLHGPMQNFCTVTYCSKY